MYEWKKNLLSSSWLMIGAAHKKQNQQKVN